MITLTYSEPINPATINGGFTGASMAIRVSITNNSDQRPDGLHDDRRHAAQPRQYRPRA